MALTKSVSDKTIKNLLPRSKPYKKFIGGGLYIEVFPDGAKRWRYKYRFGGKEKLLPLASQHCDTEG